MSSSQTFINSGVYEKTATQQGVAALAKDNQAVKQPIATNPQTASTSSAAEVKPKGWQANLTIAHIKEMKIKEAQEKHEKLHPRRTEPKPENAHQKKPFRTQPTTAKGTQKDTPRAQHAVNNEQKNVNRGSMPPRAEPAAIIGQQNLMTTKPRAEPASINEQQIVTATAPRFEQPLPPCGIRGCPIKAPHERRRYVFNELQRPPLIRIIQEKANWGEASEEEFRKLDAFFNLHRHV